MTTLTDLIAIYGRQSADQVPRDPQYDSLCKQNDGNLLFHYERLRVERLRRKLEKSLNMQQTRQSQLKSALKIFEHELAPDNNQEDEIVVRLVHAAWYPNWTPAQQQYFDDTIETLGDGLDYFLSFTLRNPVGGPNPVNTFHRYFIESYGLDPSRSANNELAKALDRALQSSKYKFRGFYFPAHEDDSQLVSKKLAEAIDRALVFIQIVQNDMFSKRFKADENYCFDEYTMASAQQKKSIYLFADGQHPADMIPLVDTFPRFSNWYQLIEQTDCVALARTLSIPLESANVAANHDLLKKRLIDKVWSFREALWEGAPADL
jgi:hypothetical protein